jgi:hypothetical protein
MHFVYIEPRKFLDRPSPYSKSLFPHLHLHSEQQRARLNLRRIILDIRGVDGVAAHEYLLTRALV